MSSLLRWATKNTVTVWPFISTNRVGGGSLYGEPYKIAATWRYKAQAAVGGDGKEYLSAGTVWHESTYPKYMDKFVLGDSELDKPPIDALTAKGVGFDDMKMFGRNEIPDRTIQF